MPCTALAYMSVMMYLESTSAAFAFDGPAKPGVRASFPATLKGSMTGSSPHTLCFSHSGVAGVAKPFCETNHFSYTGLECAQRRKSFAAFSFFEEVGSTCGGEECRMSVFSCAPFSLMYLSGLRSDSM